MSATSAATARGVIEESLNSIETKREQAKMADTEHVEMAQVPLTSDVDRPEGEVKEEEQTTVTKGEDGKTVTTTKRIRTFFTRGKKDEKKPAAAGEENAEEKPTEGGGEPEVEVKAKKPLFAGPRDWFKRKAKDQVDAETEGQEGQMTIGLNMLDRDEKNINEHVKLTFEDVFGEPDTNHSWDCGWRLANRVFLGTRCFLYRLLAVLLALPCAIIWGVLFALLTVINIWGCTPLGRALTIPATWLAKVWNFFIRSVFDPCFRSCGLCLSNVTVRRYGFSTETTVDAHMA